MAQGMVAFRITKIRFPMIMHDPTFELRQNPCVVHRGLASLRMNRIIRQPLRRGHLQPVQFSFHPHSRLIGMQHDGLA